ncbi:adenylate/guanylate cyclase domain-containing protein [Haloechinothrix halophila]|uniref:adenylate/guanylate cyclase domain-containing protein n=1 Tax=Haloechinothrix halophila TaxID=1069073 RepID=UPI000405A4A8|nr:adenylate/guanylate cyclase domain-containing protein [Haloechinothrix halophila]
MTHSIDRSLADDILGEPRNYTSRDVAAATDVQIHRARRFWRALGFANVDESEVEFTASDINALRILTSLVADDTVSEPQVVHFTRLLGRAMSRLAASHVELHYEPSDQRDNPDHDKSAEARQHTTRVSHDLEWLFGYAWRRHLRAALNRLNAHHDGTSPTTLGVGFADMVGFTELSNRTSETELTHIIERFEGRGADTITAHGGTIIKLLGDEILFAAADTDTLAEIATELIATFDNDRDIPAVRIGLTYGPIICHLGDVFGPTVNLASRLTRLAEPATILTTQQLATELSTKAEYALHPAGTHTLRGIGPTRVMRLTKQHR